MDDLRIPDVEDAKALLEEVGLPTSDINAIMIESFLGLYADGKLLALGGLEIYKEQALIRSLATTPSYRRKGLAQKIFSALEERARCSGVSDVYLLTETAESYFGKRGYVCIERDTAPSSIANTAQFRHLCPAGAVLMHKRLGT